MNQDQKAQKENFKEQLKWTKEKIRILDEMDINLHEMKKIAEYAQEHKLSASEIERFNGELNVLKNEYSYLEKQYTPVLH